MYHVTHRMVGSWHRERARPFVDDADRGRFLEQLGERVGPFRIRLYLYVLMGNHIHLVFETPEANCSRFMHAVSTAYTVYFMEFVEGGLAERDEEFLDMGAGSAVSKQIAQLRDRCSKDRGLERNVKNAMKRLDAMHRDRAGWMK